jgi:hypothetical protein
MQPESSDGLASVGTILPEEMAAEILAAISLSTAVSDRSRLYRNCSIAVNSGLDLADVAQLVEQLIRNQ